MVQLRSQDISVNICTASCPQTLTKYVSHVIDYMQH